MTEDSSRSIPRSHSRVQEAGPVVEFGVDVAKSNGLLMSINPLGALEGTFTIVQTRSLETGASRILQTSWNMAFAAHELKPWAIWPVRRSRVTGGLTRPERAIEQSARPRCWGTPCMAMAKSSSEGAPQTQLPQSARTCFFQFPVASLDYVSFSLFLRGCVPVCSCGQLSGLTS